MTSYCVVPGKYPCPHQGRLTNIPKRRGVPKAQFFERKYDAKMEFLEGGGGQFKKPSVGGVWIFSGTTHFALQSICFWFFGFFLPPDYFPTCQFDEIKSVKTLYVIQNEIE